MRIDVRGCEHAARASDGSPHLLARRAQRLRGGFTLLEVIAVMVGLLAALAFGAALVAGALKVRRAAAVADDHRHEQEVLADQFRADVRQAVALPERAGDRTAGPTCLILRRADGREVVYIWTDNELKRSDLSTGRSRELAVGPPGTAVEFVRPGSDLVTLRLLVPRATGSGDPRRALVAPRALDIAAALGGNLR